MTDKEFRRLSRPELIDIIFELRQRYDKSQQENEILRQELAKKELNITNAGSLAEAALSINGVLEAAQAAANQYLISVKAMSGKAEQIIADAEAEGARIVKEAQERAQEIEVSAGKSAALLWDDFRAKATEMIEAHKELSVTPEEDD